MRYKELSEQLPLWSPLIIERMRKKLWITQIEAAKLVRVSVFTWRSWELGNRNMPESTWELFLIKYEKALKIFEREVFKQKRD